ncbi:MAG TPA: ABC transporter permease [Vicinamibacterales bacterium]
MPTLITDLRFALRVLRRQPGFAATAILVLALGIGANVAIFSVVNTLLLKPLPGVGGDGQILGLYSKSTKKADDYRAFSYPNYVDLRGGVRTFTGVAAHTVAFAGVADGGMTRRTFVEMVSSNYFDVLGTTLARGRAFTADEEPPGRPALVTVVSHGYWQRQGADPQFIGKTATISGRPFTVVGVAPPGFSGTATGLAPEFWVPLSATELVENDFIRDDASGARGSRDRHEFLLVGRLKPGVTREAANRELAGLATRLAEAYPSANRDHTIIASPLSRLGISTNPSDDGAFVSLSAVLMGMSAVVLLVACLNLANMLLARGTARRKEIAVRLALGAGRMAIVRQLLTEGLLLSMAGGAVGLAVGDWATVLLMRSIAPLMPMPFDLDVGLDWRMTVAALAFAVIATVAFALGPALKATRPGVIEEIKEQAGEDRTRRARLFGARNLLLAGQMALSLALLVAGALFLRGALAAADATPGFAADRGLLIETDPSLAGYSPTESASAHRRLVARLRGVAGVEAVSMASMVPFGPLSESVRVESAAAPEQAAPAKDSSLRVSAQHTSIGSDYFRALNLPVVRGREFTTEEAEGTEARRITIIDEPTARKLFPKPGDNPVGQFVRVGSGENGQAKELLEVVGVVPGVRSDLFERAPSPHLYVPFTARSRAWMHYHVRTAAGAPADGVMLERLRREIRAVDPRFPVISTRTLQDFMQKSVFLWLFRSGARIFTAFGLAALVLALVGIYGVNAYMVLRRTREIGIRMALGAAPRDITRLILREAIIVTAAGVAVGLALAIAIGNLLGSMLYDVTAFDPLALITAPTLLVGSALLASYIPARRATRVAMATALRRD